MTTKTFEQIYRDQLNKTSLKIRMKRKFLITDHLEGNQILY